MYYSNGNYEAFARPEKPEGIEHKSAYLIGSGLAALSAACFLVRGILLLFFGAAATAAFVLFSSIFHSISYFPINFLTVSKVGML